MRDFHQMIVDDIGKVVGRKTVGLEQNAFVQFVIINFDVTVNNIMENGSSGLMNGLADNIRLAGGNAGARLFKAQALAGIFELDVLFVVFLLVGVSGGTETIMRAAQFYQFMRVFGIQRLALRLNVRTVIAADVRPFVPVHADSFQRVVNDFFGTLDKTLLVRIFNTENEVAAVGFGDEILVQCGSQVADVHIAGRAGGKSGSYFHNSTTYFD